MIMDYHLVFIILSVFLLMFTFIFIWVLEFKERVYPALLLCGLNIVLSQMNYLGFFGIDIIGYNGVNGSIVLNLQSEMYPYFGFFWVMYFLNVILVFYIWYKHTRGLWDIKEEENKEVDWYS